MTQKDLKFFFVERFQELVNRNSIDSYRVRCNNVFTLMKELRSVINNWRQGYVKQFETVCLCIEEVLEAMKVDDIIDYSFYDKQLMIDDLTAFCKADQKSRGEMGNQSLYLLDKCIHSNKESYLENLYIAISDILFCEREIAEGQFKPLTDRLNQLVGALACELLNERFSLRHLYRESLKLRDNENRFEDAFSDFRKKHHHGVPLNSYEVVLKMNGGHNKRLLTINGFMDKLPVDFVPCEKKNDDIDKFLSDRGGSLFYRTQMKAHDTAMAITLAVEKIESVVDQAMLGYSILDIKLLKKALVILNLPMEKVYIVQPTNIADLSYADDERVVKNMIAKIDVILNNSHVADDVKDRLKSSLRHLRIGNTETDTGQQLVNYWVALEFIFSSPMAADSTIPRLERNLINILMCCYAHRRVSHLNDLLHKNGTLEEVKNWWSLPGSDLDNIINNQNSQLVRYHLQEMKAALRGNKDAAKLFFVNHKKHLYWQIYRIYRYRNKLIHEAAILPGLENVIRCQRFYLVLLLNQLIGYFYNADVNPLTMDSFFFEYTHKYNILNNIIKQTSTGEERIEKLMQIDVYNELIRQNV